MKNKNNLGLTEATREATLPRTEITLDQETAYEKRMRLNHWTRKAQWKRVLDRRLPDLCVLYNGKTVLGFVYKLADTSTGKSQWCCNTGCGDTAKLVGHNWTLDQAKLCVEESAASNLNTEASNKE